MRDRGIPGKRGVFKAAEQYGIRDKVVDGLTFDLTVRLLSLTAFIQLDTKFNLPQHNPWRIDGFLDAIVTDPPYGVRAGAKRLGRKDPSQLSAVPYKMPDGRHSHECVASPACIYQSSFKSACLSEWKNTSLPACHGSSQTCLLSC